MTEHTPGPWYFHELSGGDSRGQGYIYGADSREISHHGVMERWREENLANADLIAAAPDLLRELKEARDELQMCAVDLTGEDYNNPSMNAAINKAEGHDCGQTGVIDDED